MLRNIAPNLPGILSRALLAAALGLGLTAAWAQQKLLPAQSEISFTTHQMGVPVDGKFTKFDAQFNFDPKQPEAGHIAFTIDTGSASFGAPETDAEVPKPAWLSAAKFPQATFASSAIKGLGGAKFSVAGKLTIKGASQSVVVPVSLTQAGGVSTASGTFTIKRLDFKIGEGEWADTSMVANDVQVKFKLNLTGLPPL